jgi:hypothetical protein
MNLSKLCITRGVTDNMFNIQVNYTYGIDPINVYYAPGQVEV